MKLILTLLVRDEEDILEANIRYHLSRGVDFIIVTDNLSVDRTPEILDRYERMGWLRVIREEDDTYAQWKWVTHMARLATVEHDADWVINADADEFWWPERGDLKAALASVPPEYGILKVPRTNFLPCRNDPVRSLQTMLVREADARSYLGRPLLPKMCHRARADVVVEQGNHGLMQEKMESPMATFDEREPITIFHYQLRGWAQFQNKIAKGGRAYERNTELPERVGRGWRMLHDLHRKGKLREYYDGQLLAEGDRFEGIADGRYVIDRRLKDYLAALPADFPA